MARRRPSPDAQSNGGNVKLANLSPYRDVERASLDSASSDNQELKTKLLRQDPMSQSPDYSPTQHLRRSRRVPSLCSVLLALVIILGASNVLQWVGPRRALSMIGHASNSTTSNPVADTQTDPAAKAVVLASFSKQNVEWATRIPEDWRVYRYIVDSHNLFPPAPSAHANATNTQRTYNLTFSTPRNQGREAMSYLTYIIDNYASLPLFTLFLHGHDRGWHQVEHAASKLRALNLTAVAEDGYVNLRCNDHRNCNATDPHANRDLSKGPDALVIGTQKPLPGFWKMIFPDGPDPPTSLMTVGYAQFAVPRHRILARPLSFWLALRAILERDFSELLDKIPELKAAGEEADKAGLDGVPWAMGLLFEQLWHVFMGATSAYCPGEQRCREVWFSGAIECDGVVEKPWEQFGWENIRCEEDEGAMARAKEAQDQAVKEARRNLELNTANA